MLICLGWLIKAAEGMTGRKVHKNRCIRLFIIHPKKKKRNWIYLYKEGRKRRKELKEKRKRKKRKQRRKEYNQHGLHVYKAQGGTIY